MKRIRVGVLLLSFTACAVDTTLPEAGTSTVNECERSSQCGESGRCVDGTCRAERGTLSSLLLEVAIPGTAKASRYAGARYLVEREGLPLGGGAFDLELPELVELSVSVVPPPCQDAQGQDVPRVGGYCPDGASAPAGAPDACPYDFGVTEIDAVISPAERFVDIPTSPITATASCGEEGCGTGVFVVRLPPGAYEIYFRPEDTAPVEGYCTPPPQLFQIDIAEPTESRELRLNVPSVFRGRVEYPLENAPDELAGWTLDVLDPVSGRRMSGVQRLTIDPAVTDVQSYPFEVAFTPMPDGDGQSGHDLVRLQPPAGVVAPRVVMERSALEIFPGDVTIDQLTEVPHAVKVEGTLSTPNPHAGEPQLAIPGTLTIVATEIELGAGVLPSFKTTVEADASGVFKVDVLPGKYQVLAEPPISCTEVAGCTDPACECPLAARKVDWIVSEASVQAGKAIEFGWRQALQGTVATAHGVEVVGAEVLGVPVPLAENALARALGVEPFTPRSSSTRVDSLGNYALFLDAGFFDVSVRPEAGTRFPWLVRPDLDLSGEVTSWQQDLTMPLPVIYSGVVSVPGAILGGAVIRAFVLRDGGDPASGLVQVGEATSNGEGRFELMLPAGLQSP